MGFQGSTYVNQRFYALENLQLVDNVVYHLLCELDLCVMCGTNMITNDKFDDPSSSLNQDLLILKSPLQES